MKNKLFGKLGEKLKGNMLLLFLAGAVGFTGIYTYKTIDGINHRLENQRPQNIQSGPADQPQQVQDVQQEQNDVPLPAKPSPQPTPQKEAQAPAESQVRWQENKKFILPTNGKIFAAFSGDELVYNRTLDDWRTHNGVDISAAPGDAVKAGADGTVANVYEDGMQGTVVVINHDGFTARYCGLAKATYVKAGEKVTQGQTIGTVGEVAMEVLEESHIHLEIEKNGKTVNPDTVLK